MNPIRIAIDAMGGDTGVGVTVPAAVSFLAAHDDARILLVGQPEPIAAELSPLRSHGRRPDRR